jgi:putative addiction module component (TIGR02574 family)
MTAVDQLFAKALELEPEDRMELAERLMETCDAPDPGWWDSVKDEVLARATEVELGLVETVPYETVRARMYERLRAHER